MAKLNQICPCIFLAILFSLSAETQAAAQKVTIIGPGVNASCGKWLAERKSGSYFQMSGWALGYLSGAATFHPSLNPLHGMDADGVEYWLDNYCRSHPTQQFADALKAFVDEHPQ